MGKSSEEKYRFRSAITGRFATALVAKIDPDVYVSEAVSRGDVVDRQVVEIQIENAILEWQSPDKDRVIAECVIGALRELDRKLTWGPRA